MGGNAHVTLFQHGLLSIIIAFGSSKQQNKSNISELKMCKFTFHANYTQDCTKLSNAFIVDCQLIF